MGYPPFLNHMLGLLCQLYTALKRLHIPSYDLNMCQKKQCHTIVNILYMYSDSLLVHGSLSFHILHFVHQEKDGQNGQL